MKATSAYISNVNSLDIKSKCKKTDVTTIVDIFHLGDPKWIHKFGGWASKETVEKFLEHIDFATEEYDRYIDYYQILNEPPCEEGSAMLKGTSTLKV